MNASTISEIIVATAVAVIGVAYLVNTGMTYRARLRAESNTAANDALEAALATRAHVARQLDESRDLAEKFRAHREWIEENPEQFRAALRSHLNGAAPVTDR